ncbi:MAG: glycosyltransferase family 2 protein [Sphingobacteriales bacterium]|nr:glycosyltransferase family 2 protein [Sphingobacteriales bacterium]
MKQFSFIILTFNEEKHLQRLLDSINTLDASIFVLDSGSIDKTLNICEINNIQVAYNKFENHPKQWDTALKKFPINTPWVIGLDADQIVTPELLLLLQNFKDEDFRGINGIYFNRKNYFKGNWIRFGGYYPKYLLKMFRYGVGYSDLNENMDHRFIAPGKTVIWKQGHILEENLKENNISFWIDKHNRYSDLLAHEELERINKVRSQSISPFFWGSPDERTAWLKRLWWNLPRFIRPFLYFIYRLIFQLGILDGKTGILFHFLQGFWFRVIVDVKLAELLKQESVQKTSTR